jgi:hypothetical protein
VNKPQQAEFLLNHPLVEEFFTQLHAQVYSGLKRCKTDETRNQLAAYGRFADEFEGFFRRYIETGKLEQLDAERQAEAERLEKSLLERVRAKFPRW